MNAQRMELWSSSAAGRGGLAVALLGCVLATACSKPDARGFDEFMEDRIAREGVIARCNQNREATENDIECANARRAASTIALREEQARRRELELESDKKLSMLRAEIERRDRAKREAMDAALKAAQAAYEAQWAKDEVGVEDGIEAALQNAAPSSDEDQRPVKQFGSPVQPPVRPVQEVATGLLPDPAGGAGQDAEQP
jgi:hypothetical protein